MRSILAVLALVVSVTMAPSSWGDESPVPGPHPNATNFGCGEVQRILRGEDYVYLAGVACARGGAVHSVVVRDEVQAP